MGTRAAWLAWALAALSVAMFLASGVLHVLARSAQSPFDLALFMADSSRRDGTGDAEQRLCGREKGDDAACSRLALVAPRQASEGLAGGSLALYPAGAHQLPGDRLGLDTEALPWALVSASSCVEPVRRSRPKTVPLHDASVPFPYYKDA
jgi:hypothetical protein